jgi:hypothetical protein
MGQKERRSAPRIEDDELSLELHSGNFDIMAHTLNISESGLYCKVDRDLPIMSRIKLMLMIPGRPDSKKEAGGVEVEGVVVRAHPVIINGKVKHYDVAIFFDNLSSRARDIIKSYISVKKGETRR